LKGCRENNDRHFRATLTEFGCYVGSELPCAQMVVEYGNVYLIQKLARLFDSGSGFGQVPVLAEDGGSQQKVLWMVIQEQHAYRLGNGLPSLLRFPGFLIFHVFCEMQH